MSVDWDVDVIDYWQTSLSSYKKHHEQDIQVESDKVTGDILDNLPIKEGVRLVDEQVETEPVKVSIKRKEITQEAAQVGNWSVVEEEEEEIEKEEKEEEEEEKECIGEEEPSVKKPRYNPSVPAPAPPPPVQQDNEALSNLMMAWYYAGYYTGVYQANHTQ
ncbi:hypothetical protein INT48_008901 [Thamnidium elegans]|uniref:Survival motor neuron protein n=1 Tax=Thamnidium elegans TaxID=101142 RepID=A0A8H7SHR6_9FUNG|nr:hypothetical protein INT48_008901 [Thamnidium elegans]